MSYVHSEIRNANATFSNIDPSTTFEFKGDPKVNVWTPSLRLGLIVYFAR